MANKKKTVRKKKKNFSTYVLQLLSIISSIALLISFSALYIDPDKFWPPTFFGLAFPVFYIINIIFLIIWLIKKRLFLLTSLIPLILSFHIWSGYYKFSTKEHKVPEETNTLKVLSYNISIFNKFYSHKSFNYIDSLVSFIRDINPDVICFQEYYNNKVADTQLNNYLKKTLNMPYMKNHIYKERYDEHEFGIATFSKYPIIKTETLLNVNYSHTKQTSNFATYSDIVIKNDTIRFYNLHLESNRLSSEDIFFSSFEDITEINIDNIPSKSKIVLSKLRKCIILRSRQIVPIKENINNSPYPVIIAGDFNDVPASWTYRYLSKGLKDSFKKGGKGFAKTYNSIVPFMKIDYILHSPDIETIYFDIPKVEFSDHFPIFSTFKLPSKSKEKN